MVAISYNNSNNLTKLQAESIVNRENIPEKIQLTQQNRVKKIYRD